MTVLIPRIQWLIRRDAGLDQRAWMHQAWIEAAPNGIIAGHARTTCTAVIAGTSAGTPAGDPLAH